MSNSENKVSKIIEKIQNNKKVQYLLVGIVAIIVVVVLIANFNFSNGVDKDVQTSDKVSEYVKNLEYRLSNTLSLVDGAGNVSVVITVSSGMETVLATTSTTTTTPSGTETIETPLIVNGKTVVLMEVYPKITGVLIVAQGAKNIAVLNKIQQAAVSLLDINVNQIEILTMK